MAAVAIAMSPVDIDSNESIISAVQNEIAQSGDTIDHVKHEASARVTAELAGKFRGKYKLLLKVASGMKDMGTEGLMEKQVRTFAEDLIKDVEYEMYEKIMKGQGKMTYLTRSQFGTNGQAGSYRNCYNNWKYIFLHQLEKDKIIRRKSD